MSVAELIASGVCEDLEEALSMFPVELLDDFRPGRGEVSGSCRGPRAGQPSLGTSRQRRPAPKIIQFSK